MLQKAPTLVKNSTTEGTIGTVQPQDCQVRMSTAFDVYQNTTQLIYNGNTDHLVKHYMDERLGQVEQSFQLIIQLFCLYISTLDEEKSIPKIL